MSAALRLGFFAALGAYVIWGSLPLYIRLMKHIPPVEFLAHRIVWSLPTVLIMIGLAGNWRDIKAAFTAGRLKWLMLSSVLIGVNWLIYIWAVNVDRTTEASLGYFMNPMMNVVLGLIIFKERLSPAQWGAVALAIGGVLVMTAAVGHVPWVAIGLCLTWGVYSLIRKQVQVDSRVGFAIEAAVLFPLALFWLTRIGLDSEGAVFGRGGWDIALLMAAGPITAVPLILYAIGAKRLKLSTLGMMQYVGPTLQFLIATLIFREPFGLLHAIAFALIWSALFVYTGDTLVNEARNRKLSRTRGIL